MVDFSRGKMENPGMIKEKKMSGQFLFFHETKQIRFEIK